MTAFSAELARLSKRLADLRTRAAAAPLTRPHLRELERTADALTALVPRLAAADAALTESRGLELEDTRAELAQVRTLDLDAAMVVVRAQRDAGRVRSAARGYWRLVRRAPRDRAWVDRLAGFGHLLDQYGDVRGAGMCRAVAGSLIDGWWRDPIALGTVEHALAEVRVEWAALPEGV
ncbi:MAG: hypothetical protein IPL61_40525 [Myxococcales bacterium]|nr:hypothetical protein [Myxococcales bacterium]